MRKQVIIPSKYDFMRDNNNQLDYFSYSRINIKCPYEFYLKKIKGVDQEDSVYTAIGTLIHDLIEDFYFEKISKEEMIDEFKLQFALISKAYIFKTEISQNNKMFERYYNDLLHFFQNHLKLNGIKVIEQLVFINIKDKHLLIGYIDMLSREGNKLIITDWKTSTIYTKKKQEEYAEQLILYAIGLSQNFKVNLNQIKVRWNFVRYVKIIYKLVNNSEKITYCERSNWVDKMSTQIKRRMKHSGYDSIETSYLISECIKNNSLDILSESVQKNFVVSEAYVDYDFNADQVRRLKNKVEVKCDQIIERGKSESAWLRDEKIDNKDMFYCNVLCGVKKHCFYYKDYLNDKDFYINN
jgi:hypothetical protein